MADVASQSSGASSSASSTSTSADSSTSTATATPTGQPQPAATGTRRPHAATQTKPDNTGAAQASPNGTGTAPLTTKSSDGSDDDVNKSTVTGSTPTGSTPTDTTDLGVPDSNPASPTTSQSTATASRGRGTSPVSSTTPPPTSSVGLTSSDQSPGASITSTPAFTVDELNPLESSSTLSSFTTTYQTTLSDGSIITTSGVIQTRIPIQGINTAIQSANTGANPDAGRGGTDNPSPARPLPFTPNPVPKAPFFKRPAAAAGVFIAAFLATASLVWLFCIIRRHRRQKASVDISNRNRGSYYAYGSTGVSRLSHRSRTSYNSQDWPQRFEDDEMREAPTTSQPPPAAQPPTDWRQRTAFKSLTPVVQFFNPHKEAPYQTIVDSNLRTLEDAATMSASWHRRPPSISTSPPPVPPRSPLRSNSPPIRRDPYQVMSTSDSHQSPTHGGDVFDPLPRMAPITDLAPPLAPSLMPLSRTRSGRPRQRAFSPSISQPPPSATYSVHEEQSNHLLLRRPSDKLYTVEDPFASDARVIPSPTPSVDPNSRLSNPFSDADSPPQSPTRLEYIHDRNEATNSVVLEHGVSLRRSSTLRDKPSQAFSPAQVASTIDFESSGSEAAPHGSIPSQESSFHGHHQSPQILRIKTSHRTLAARRNNSQSESLASAYSSEGTSEAHANVIGTPDENELFYKVGLTSPIGGSNRPNGSDIR